MGRYLLKGIGESFDVAGYLGTERVPSDSFSPLVKVYSYIQMAEVEVPELSVEGGFRSVLPPVNTVSVEREALLVPKTCHGPCPS
ncbi:hypothetical protein [Streptomyces sp. NPDC055085]